MSVVQGNISSKSSVGHSAEWQNLPDFFGDKGMVGKLIKVGKGIVDEYVGKSTKTKTIFGEDEKKKPLLAGSTLGAGITAVLYGLTRSLRGKNPDSFFGQTFNFLLKRSLDSEPFYNGVLRLARFDKDRVNIADLLIDGALKLVRPGEYVRMEIAEFLFHKVRSSLKDFSINEVDEITVLPPQARKALKLITKLADLDGSMWDIVRSQIATIGHEDSIEGRIYRNQVMSELSRHDNKAGMSIRESLLAIMEAGGVPGKEALEILADTDLVEIHFFPDPDMDSPAEVAPDHEAPKVGELEPSMDAFRAQIDKLQSDKDVEKDRAVVDALFTRIGETIDLLKAEENIVRAELATMPSQGPGPALHTRVISLLSAIQGMLLLVEEPAKWNDEIGKSIRENIEILFPKVVSIEAIPNIFPVDVSSNFHYPMQKVAQVAGPAGEDMMNRLGRIAEIGGRAGTAAVMIVSGVALENYVEQVAEKMDSSRHALSILERLGLKNNEMGAVARGRVRHDIGDYSETNYAKALQGVLEGILAKSKSEKVRGEVSSNLLDIAEGKRAGDAESALDTVVRLMPDDLRVLDLVLDKDYNKGTEAIEKYVELHPEKLDMTERMSAYLFNRVGDQILKIDELVGTFKDKASEDEPIEKEIARNKIIIKNALRLLGTIGSLVDWKISDADGITTVPNVVAESVRKRILNYGSEDTPQGRWFRTTSWVGGFKGPIQMIASIETGAGFIMRSRLAQVVEEGGEPGKEAAKILTSIPLVSYDTLNVAQDAISILGRLGAQNSEVGYDTRALVVGSIQTFFQFDNIDTDGLQDSLEEMIVGSESPEVRREVASYILRIATQGEGNRELAEETIIRLGRGHPDIRDYLLSEYERQSQFATSSESLPFSEGLPKILMVMARNDFSEGGIAVRKQLAARPTLDGFEFRENLWEGIEKREGLADYLVRDFLDVAKGADSILVRSHVTEIVERQVKLEKTPDPSYEPYIEYWLEEVRTPLEDSLKSTSNKALAKGILADLGLEHLITARSVRVPANVTSMINRMIGSASPKGADFLEVDVDEGGKGLRKIRIRTKTMERLRDTVNTIKTLKAKAKARAGRK